MTSVRQLEERIKRLGRTVRVNLETSGSSKTDKGGAALIQNPQQTQAATAAVAAYGTQVAKVAKQSSELTDALSKQATVSDKLNAKVKAIAQNKRDLTQAQNGFAMKGKTVKQSLAASRAALEANVNWLKIYQGQLRAAGAEVVALQQKETAAANAAAAAIDKKNAALQRAKNIRRGLQAGALAGATQIPGISPIASGASAGAFFGGPAGAAAGAAAAGAVQLTAAAVAYGNAAAKAAADTERLQIALGSVVGADGFQGAVEATQRLSDEFNTAIPDVTKEFTKLTAAVKANNGTVEESEGIYKGLAAANAALGGDAQDLQGILRATTQVLSKGKVQAEELRGQIGERLPGAFALFADAQGLTLAQLDKALEQGKVSAKDFVDFAIDLYDKYGEAAKQINESPAAAGQRLEKNLKNLQVAIGNILAPIGAAFQNVFSGIVEDITAATNALARFLGLGLSNAIAKAERAVADARANLESVRNRDFSNQQPGREAQALARAQAQLTIAEQNLRVLKDRQKLEEAAKREANQPDPTQTDAEQKRIALQRLNAEIRADLEAQLNLLDKYETKGTFNYDILVAQAEAYAQIRQVNASVTDELTRQSKIREILNRLDRESRTIQKGYAQDAQDALQARSQLINDISNSTNKDFKGEAEKVKEVPEEIQRAFDGANQAGNELYRTFENLIFATENWRDTLVDVLQSLSSMFLKLALGNLANGDGKGLFSFLNGSLNPSTAGSSIAPLANQPNFSSNLGSVNGLAGFKAGGGRVSGASPYVVGEKGPELFVPGKTGTIVPADVFSATRSAIAGNGKEGGDSDAFDQNAAAIGASSTISKEKIIERNMMRASQAPVDVRYESTVINSVEYVTADQFQQGIKDSVKQSRASVYKELRNKPAARSGVGI